MITDALLFFEPLAGTTVTATAVSTNVLDLGIARDIGGGRGIMPGVNIAVLSTFTGTSPTINVQLQGAPDNGSGAPGTYTVMIETGVIASAQLVKGANFRFDIPSVAQLGLTAAQVEAIPRFLRLNYVITGTTPSGVIWAGIILSDDDPALYPPGFVFPAGT
jgi:hypothetical protein